MKKLQSLIREIHDGSGDVEANQKLLNQLIPEDIDVTTQYPSELYEDLKSYLSERDKEWSQVALNFKFMYFSTQLVHVFGKYDARNLFYPRSIVTLKPCVWIDIDNDFATLKYCKGIDDEMPFKVTLHVVHSVDKMDTRNISFDLKTKKAMVFSKGESLQIAVRMDKKPNHTYLSFPHPKIDCLVMLTYQMEYNGVYYKSRNCKFIAANHKI